MSELPDLSSARQNLLAGCKNNLHILFFYIHRTAIEIGISFWEIPGMETSSGKKLRFTQKEGKMYMHFFDPPGKEEDLPGLLFRKNCKAVLLDGGIPVKWKQKGDNVELSFPGKIEARHVSVVEISALPEIIE